MSKVAFLITMRMEGQLRRLENLTEKELVRNRCTNIEIYFDEFLYSED